MNLYAISDLHLGYSVNRQALAQLPAYPNDWLIVAGDVGETEAQFVDALQLLTSRFAQVLWVPGNHDLWTLPNDPGALRGEAKYQRLVEICHKFGVLTPEDPYVVWPGASTPYLLAPLFLLYDYTFRPSHVAAEEALAWAEAENTICADEVVLHPDPYPTRDAWCHARCRYTEQRLIAAVEGMADQSQLILINHFPLRSDLAVLPRIPRFSLWCGTTWTATWHTRFPVAIMIYGHLHIRNTQLRDGVRCEEVSLGYPRQWQPERGVAAYLRKILPTPAR
ncbi:MAG: metallophosphoesterase [Caldilineaceae bacterium]|nr:metallophosphoesterase [Caldilineaceae bacterium]